LAIGESTSEIFRQSPSYLRKSLPSKFHLFLKTTIYCLPVNMVLDMEDPVKQPCMKLSQSYTIILGPFFIIFINDLAFYLIHIVIKLFADDTTLIIAEHN
jgi:hypothetical protein